MTMQEARFTLTYIICNKVYRNMIRKFIIHYNDRDMEYKNIVYSMISILEHCT